MQKSVSCPTNPSAQSLHPTVTNEQRFQKRKFSGHGFISVQCKFECILKDSVEWELRCLFISESQTAAYLLGLATGFMFVVSWILRGLLIIVLLVWVNRTVHSQKATLFLSYHPRIQFDLVGGELDQIESMWERTRWGRTCYEAKPAATIKNNKQWMQIIPWILLYPPKTNCIIS